MAMIQKSGLHRTLSPSSSLSVHCLLRQCRTRLVVVKSISSSSSLSSLHHHEGKIILGNAHPQLTTTTNTTTSQQRPITSWLQPPGISISGKQKKKKKKKVNNEDDTIDHAIHVVQDIGHVFHMVQAHDPAAVLPGRLLPTPEMQLSYFAVRSFWIETGLRFGTTAHVPPNSTPTEHLDWWSRGITSLYENDNDADNSTTFHTHPTLRLLRYLKDIEHISFTKCHFDDILTSRRNDLDMKQYVDMNQMIQNSIQSCGSLFQLVLESSGHGNYYPNSGNTSKLFHTVAKEVGITHGLANALRLSIPIVSTTGKLIIPQDLCLKYNIKSPRYLLSSLGQGDETCKQQLASAVEEISMIAKQHLQQARSHRNSLLLLEKEEEGTTTGSTNAAAAAMKVLLPVLASETFLQRLEHVNYDLTNRDLRRVSWWEHTQCAYRIILASYQQRY